MASITTILGTDSLASSRIVLNDNFASINDELEDVTGLLDVASQDLTLTGAVSSKRLSVSDGGNLLSVNLQTGLTVGVSSIFEGSLTLEGGRITIPETATTDLPAANDYQSEVYMLTATPADNTIKDGDNGQMVTFINTSGAAVTLTGQVSGAAATIAIDPNGSISLVFDGGSSSWYITAERLVTVS